MTQSCPRADLKQPHVLMNTTETSLDRERLVRVHRSHIINLPTDRTSMDVSTWAIRPGTNFRGAVAPAIQSILWREDPDLAFESFLNKSNPTARFPPKARRTQLNTY
jgi:hypothetical protein